MDATFTRPVDEPYDQGRPVRVCYLQAYRSPSYIRGRSIRAALETADGIEMLPAVNVSAGWRRYLEMLDKLLWIRRHQPADIYLLGFRGHEIGWLVRWLTRGKPLVFDAMMSPWAAMHEEGKLGFIGRLLAPYWRWYEQWMLHQSDAVLTDTQLHSRFYQHTFEVPPDRLLSIPVGAVESMIGNKRCQSHEGSFHVLFYGSLLPLHGIDVILDAACKVKDLPLVFKFVGGTTKQALRLGAQCKQHRIQYTYQEWIPFDQLLEDTIPSADLCLGGPFGGTPQALRVVTGKTSQCLALGKATVIGRIEEDCGFIDRANCLMVEQNDADALARTIRWAYEHRAELPGIGQRGRELYAQYLSTRVIGERLLPLIRRLVVDDAARPLA